MINVMFQTMHSPTPTTYLSGQGHGRST